VECERDRCIKCQSVYGLVENTHHEFIYRPGFFAAFAKKQPKNKKKAKNVFCQIGK